MIKKDYICKLKITIPYYEILCISRIVFSYYLEKVIFKETHLDSFLLCF